MATEAGVQLVSSPRAEIGADPCWRNRRARNCAYPDHGGVGADEPHWNPRHKELLDNVSVGGECPHEFSAHWSRLGQRRCRYDVVVVYECCGHKPVPLRLAELNTRVTVGAREMVKAIACLCHCGSEPFQATAGWDRTPSDAAYKLPHEDGKRLQGLLREKAKGCKFAAIDVLEVGFLRICPNRRPAIVVWDTAKDSTQVLKGFREDLRPLYRIRQTVSVVCAHGHYYTTNEGLWNEVHVGRRDIVLAVDGVARGKCSVPP